MAATETLYILYNADGSIMGKLRYGYRKITCPADADSACAACDITHGGLSLNETPAWVKAKKQIEKSSNLKVVQLHRDELSSQLKGYLEKHRIAYPAVVLDHGDSNFATVMTREELAKCKGDATVFVNELGNRKLLTEDQPRSSM